MGISKEEAIKELQTREEIFVAYSQATKLPYVKCDEETFNDQAWIFSFTPVMREKALLWSCCMARMTYPM